MAVLHVGFTVLVVSIAELNPENRFSFDKVYFTAGLIVFTVDSVLDSVDIDIL